ncbi:MAG: elongation factor G [Chloroflexi bacterium]|nr:elongation factor G [Chloroflexota bacterium]
MDYKMDQLRNVVLLGHGSCGKTSLSEAMLFDTGATTRLGTIENKNTVSDYDEEEQARGFSVNTSVLPCEWRQHKINVLDAPGYTDFVGEVKTAIRAADGAIVVVCAASGVEVGTELHWSFLEEELAHRLVFINKMDRDNANFANVLEELRTKFDKTFVPVVLPIGSQSMFSGVIDLIEMKAYLDSKGEGTAIPAGMQEQAEEARVEMMEYAAEVDDELMMKYLDGEELTNDEIRAALAQGMAEGKLVPVLAGSATKNLGIIRLLDAIIDFMPKPSAVERRAVNVATGESEVIEQDPAGPLVAQIFKTLADPFVGKLSYFRVFSGTIQSDSRVMNVNKNEEERLGQLFSVRGKEQTPVPQVRAGDIGAVAKLTVTTTGDTLGDRGAPYRMPGVVYPEPLYAVAIFPKTQADLDKMSAGLARLVDEDPTLRVERNAETGETILSGMGDSHIQLAVRRLAQKFGVEVDTDLPKIPYRETITKTAQAQGRHKKQTGGRGQFGDVYCRFEPLERGAGFEFVSEIFGGSVPKQYVPAVEKGIREAMMEGVIAGYPTVDFRCALYDGSSHPVDSSELAFKLAAHLAFRNAIPQAGPVLLEPVYKIRVTVPEEFMGDIMGDLNTRRAQILGMEQSRGTGIITALVPLAEIQRYATDLRSMTQGRGIYTMEFSHYDIVPAHLVDAIKAEAQRRAERANQG